MTLGYERYANLAPDVTELQSFGHVSVSEDGELAIKLMGIDGTVMYEVFLTPSSIQSNNTNLTNSTSTISTQAAVESLSTITNVHQPFDGELPITTTDVFISSGETTSSSINIMTRCNNEANSTMKLLVDGQEQNLIDVNGGTDYTNTFVVNGLSPDTAYTYQVQCIPSDGETTLDSMEGSFKTVPGADEASAVSFVWVSCLSGQGYGRNPDFEITNTDGNTVKGEIHYCFVAKNQIFILAFNANFLTLIPRTLFNCNTSGGYIVFDTMERLAPDFAIFQGDMIYADNPIPAALNYTNGTEVLGTWYNNPTKNFVATTLEDFR